MLCLYAHLSLAIHHCWYNISESFKAGQDYNAMESLIFTWSPQGQILLTHHVSLQCCQFFIVSLQVYDQLFAKVLTLSRFWTSLHMAMKFYHAMSFNAVVNSAIYSQVCNALYSSLIFWWLLHIKFQFLLNMWIRKLGWKIYNCFLTITAYIWNKLK